MSSCRAIFRMAMPNAPLCDMKAMRPVSGRVGAKVASMLTAGSVLITPMQFGPIIRMPYCRTRSPSRASNRFPSSPVSAKPAVITTRPVTPFFAQSSTTPSTSSRGTTMTAMSTGSGIAETVGKAFME